MENYTIAVVGMGPGSEEMMTGQAKKALAEADVIVGYTVYLELLKEAFPGKVLLSTPMRKEEERCRLCFEIAENGLAAAAGKARRHDTGVAAAAGAAMPEGAAEAAQNEKSSESPEKETGAAEGASFTAAMGTAESRNDREDGEEITAENAGKEAYHRIAMVCSGDAGVYGMASLMYEIAKEYPKAELAIIPGITAALSGGAVLGAPLSNDFCTISLSDYLTPWDRIEQRLTKAAEADFAIALYNPSSHKRKDYLARACEILLRVIEPERACGYVENIGRDGTTAHVCTLGELKDREVNMFTTVFIGNSTAAIEGNKLVSKRGYPVEMR